MFITRPDAHLYTVSFGAGPRTLLALGGWIGSWELWAEPFALLSSSWRTIAYDHRGSGATLASPDTITLAALLDDLFAVLDTLAIERCVLAAESAGAVTALQAVLQQPQRFAGLVICAGLYHRERPATADPFVASLRADFPATLRQFVDACVPESASAALRRWGRQIVERSSPEAAVRLYECLYDLDLRSQLATIPHPSLIIHGEADQIVPVSAAEWLVGQLAHGQLHIVPGAGHVPTMTQPRVVADAIERFFAGADLT